MATSADAWNQLKEDLHLPVTQTSHNEDLTNDASVESQPLTPEAAKLEKEVLKAWSRHDKSEAELGPLLYQLCKELNAQGKAGKGFKAWLEKHKKPKSTAYRWIRSYAQREGLELPFPERNKKSPTSSHVGQGSKSAVIADNADFIPPPISVAETTHLIDKFLGHVPGDKRLTCAMELKSWLEAYIAALSSTTPLEVQ